MCWTCGAASVAALWARRHVPCLLSACEGSPCCSAVVARCDGLGAASRNRTVSSSLLLAGACRGRAERHREDRASIRASCALAWLWKGDGECRKPLDRIVAEKFARNELDGSLAGRLYIGYAIGLCWHASMAHGPEVRMYTSLILQVYKSQKWQIRSLHSFLSDMSYVTAD